MNILPPQLLLVLVLFGAIVGLLARGAERWDELWERDDTWGLMKVVAISTLGALLLLGTAQWIAEPTVEQPEIRRTVVVLAEASDVGAPRSIVCVTNRGTPRFNIARPPAVVDNGFAGFGPSDEFFVSTNSQGPFMTEAAYEALLPSCVPFTGLDGTLFPSSDSDVVGLDPDGDLSDEYECAPAIFVVDRDDAAARLCEILDSDTGPSADSFRTPQGVVIERVDVTDDGRADFVIAGDEVIQLDRSSNLVEFGLVMLPTLLTSMVALYVAWTKREPKSSAENNTAT